MSLTSPPSEFLTGFYVGLASPVLFFINAFRKVDIDSTPESLTGDEDLAAMRSDWANVGESFRASLGEFHLLDPNKSE